MLPILEDENRFPPIVDNIHIDIKAWDELKPKLIAAGLRLGPEHIPAKFYKAYMEEEVDSLAMGVFEGDYRQLLSLFGGHTKNLDNLLPFLKRENDSSSVRAAILMSSVDLANFSTTIETEQLVQEILKQSELAYGAVSTSRYAKSFAQEMAEALEAVQPKVVNSITGPFWYEQAKYHQHATESVLTLKSLGGCFLVDGRLLCLI